MPQEAQKISFVENLLAFVRTQAQNANHVLPKGVPVHVSAIKQGPGQVDLLELTIDATGPYTLPKIIAPQAHSKYHREPTQVGDKGYYVPSTYYIGGESGQGGGTASLYPRGNLTTGVFHPISNANWDQKDPNMFLVTGGPSGHTIQSQDKTTSMVIDALNNILHTASANIGHSAAKALTQIAQETLTHAAIGDNGLINMVVQKALTIGAPSSSARTDDLDNPPQPINPTVVNIIGNLIASGMVAAAGGMAGAGSSGGAPAGSTPPAGSVGEVISAVNTAGTAMAANVGANIASIVLTPGDWDIQGQIFFGLSGATTSLHAAISLTSATQPAVSLNQSRGFFNGSFSGNNQIGLSPCRANITVNTTYYLVAQTAVACTGTGVIWARRMR